MKQRGRRKLDCWVNGQSSVRIKNRIHLEGRGPEDGSVLLHVRGNEELCWSQLFHFRRNEFVQEVRERLRKRERKGANAVSLSVEPSKTSSSQAQERAGTVDGHGHGGHPGEGPGGRPWMDVVMVVTQGRACEGTVDGRGHSGHPRGAREDAPRWRWSWW